MGNNSNKSGGKDGHRQSHAELEELRAMKRLILDCLEAAGVPTQEQDVTCSVLINAGINTEARLLGCTAESLTALGVKPEAVQMIVNGKEQIKNRRVRKSTAPGDSTTKKTVTENTWKNAKASNEIVKTKFQKGDLVEHYRASDHLLRKGKVVGVHLDDLVNGVYYTVLLEGEEAREVQSSEGKLEAPGVWVTRLKSEGIEPIYSELPEPEPEESVLNPPQTGVTA